MKETDKFFNARNRIDSVNDEGANITLSPVEFAEVFAKLTYQSIYIIDYHQQGFDYVSDNPLFLSGKTKEEVQAMGYEFYVQNVKKEDLKLLLKINEAGFIFFDKLPVDERKLYTISYDFHLTNESKRQILINHKLTPLILNGEGKIWKALCVVSLSTNQDTGNIYIQKQNSNTIWKYDVEGDFWLKEEKIKLTERETEILELYSRGFKINEIADKLFISQDTVKFHRKKLFEKMAVDNITEALSQAVNYKLI